MKGLIREIHLYCGLIAGLFIFFVSFSGAVLVFEQDIIAARSVDLKAGSPLPVGHLKELLESTQGQATQLDLPQDSQSPYIFTVKKDPKERRGKKILIDPVTGDILPEPKALREFFFFFFRLHRWLLLPPESGGVIVGISTAAFVILLLSGLYLWWPKSQKHLRQSLGIRFTKNWRRLNYDLHNSLGFYSLLPLLIMALTGLCWSSGAYRSVASSVLGAEIFGGRGGRPAQVNEGINTLSYEALLAIGNAHLPYRGEVALSFPGSARDAVVFRKKKTESFSLNGMESLHIDPYTGKILKRDLLEKKNLGEKIATLVRPIHTGEFLGLTSKLIYFLTCLVATSLPVTGLFIWLLKQKKKTP